MKLTKKRQRIIATLQKHDGVNIEKFGADWTNRQLTPDLHGLQQAGVIEINRRGTVFLTRKGNVLEVSEKPMKL